MTPEWHPAEGVRCPLCEAHYRDNLCSLCGNDPHAPAAMLVEYVLTGYTNISGVGTWLAAVRSLRERHGLPRQPTRREVP